MNLQEEHPYLDSSESFKYGEKLRYEELLSGVLHIDQSIRENTTALWKNEISFLKRRQLPEIRVVITSPGGGAYYSLAIFDALRDLSKSGCKVVAIAEGLVASAASMVILQAADWRISRPNARFLFHEVRRWVFFATERTSDLLDEVTEMKNVEMVILKLLANRCAKTYDEMQRLIERKEVWMSASEARDFGVIDEII